MRYLLDTHVWLLAMEAPDRLSPAVRHVLFDSTNLPFGISVISAWEVVKKESIGRLRLSSPIRQWLSSACREPFVELLPLSLDTSYEANHLPGSFHRDPADQIIVATGRIHSLTLITADAKILEYPHVKTLKAKR